MSAAMNKSLSDAPSKKEETYQLLEQLDHILKRPETYIGSNRPCREVKSPRPSLLFVSRSLLLGNVGRR